MSAYVLDRKHFLSIAAFVRENGGDNSTYSAGKGPCLFVWRPETQPYAANYRTPLDVANELLRENTRSVNHRYSEKTKVKAITEKELAGVKAPTPAQLYGILSSLRYQSCECDDYKTTLGADLIHGLYELALQAVAKAEVELLGGEVPIGSTYEWA